MLKKLYKFALILINIITNYMLYQAQIITTLVDKQNVKYNFTFFAYCHDDALDLLRKYMHVHNCEKGSLSFFHDLYARYVFVCSVEMPPSIDFDKIPMPDYVKKTQCSEYPRLF